MQINLRIELKQWPAHRLWENLVNKKNIPYLRKMNLENLEKKLTPCCCLFQPTCLIHFALIPNLHLLRPLFICGQRIVALQRISNILDFIFHNYSSFVNPSLHLILCSGGVYICKIKKNMVSCHAATDKLLVEWLPRELWQLYKQRKKVIRDSFLTRRIFLIKSCSTVTQPKAVFWNSLIWNKMLTAEIV